MVSSPELHSLRHIASILQSPRTSRLFNGDRLSELCLDVYHQYNEYQWHLFAGGKASPYLATRTPGDILRLIQCVSSGETREELNLRLKSTMPTAKDDACERSIDLAARCIVMMKIGVPKDQLMPQRCLQWGSGSIKDFISGFFNETPKLSYDRIRLPKTFDIWSINKIAGINICFTDNLADHLLLTDDDSILLIFHHVSFLECHVHHSPTGPSPVYPPGLVGETLRTIALLFPQPEFTPSTAKRKSRQRASWLRRLRHTHEKSGQHPTSLDPRLSLCGTLQAHDRQIERFHYWRDRLVILKQTYDDATPGSLQQWWYDRRNGVQWYTFWVAVLVLLVTTSLSLLQTVAAGLQVYKAYVPSGEPSN